MIKSMDFGFKKTIIMKILSKKQIQDMAKIMNTVNK